MSRPRSYRASKAAANQVVKTFALELKNKSANNSIALALHPGTVTGTSLSSHVVDPSKGGSAKGVHEPDQAVSMLFEQIAKLKLADTGKFIAYDGQELPW